VKASPLASARSPRQSGVDLKLLQGSGPGGRVVRRDVEAASSGSGGARPAMAPAVAAGVEFEDQPLSQMRALIAKRMPLSKGARARHAGLPARRGPGFPVVPPALAEPMLTIQIREQIGDDPPGPSLDGPDPLELRGQERLQLPGEEP